MDTEELKNLYKNRDRAVRVLSKDGKFRVVAVKNSKTSREAVERHNLNNTAAFLLSRALATASMMASLLKGEERITLELKGGGPISKIYAEAVQLGECRGYVDFNTDRETREIDDITEAIGAGFLTVTRILYNKSEPLVSIVPLVRGDVANDVAYYYAQSEQIPTVVILDVDFDEKGLIDESVGLMIQAMPDSTESDIENLYASISEIDSLTNLIRNNGTPLDMLKEILPFEFDLLNSTQVDFFCRCSKDSFIAKLKTLNIKELETMRDEGHNELVCHYCNNHYYLDPEDFNNIISELKIQSN